MPSSSRKMSALAVALVLASASVALASDDEPVVADGPTYSLPAPEPAPRMPEQYQAISAQAEKIYQFAKDRDTALRNLQYLSDHIGNRLSGSKELERAVDWAAAEMRKGGLRVQKQPVRVPRWVRGEESATLLAPMERELHILGLGMTVGGTVEGEVVVLTDFDALESTKVDGKIVLFDVPFTTYGETVKYRTQGPSRAAAKGAIGLLIRSVTSASLSTPHTGTLSYDEAQPKIPAAALSIEDASWIHRLYDDGETVRVRLSLGAKHDGMVESHNVIADLRGSELPNEAVLVGCHLDSWDVGQGAQDDGAGCMIAWEAAQLLKEMGLKPRRTIRVVLFTAEENGIWGGRAYAEERFNDYAHVAALESDSGNGRADGFRLDVSGFEDPAQIAKIRKQAVGMEVVLKHAGVSSVHLGYSGADVGPTVRKGVPGFGLNHDTTTYWPIHHTDADTFDKIIPADLAHNVGVMAAAVYFLAQSPEPLITVAPPKKRRGKR